MAALVAVTVLGAAPFTAQNLAYPGQGTALASGVLRAIAAVAGTWCVGHLVYAVLARQRTGGGRLVVEWVDGRPVARSATVWAGAALLLAFVDAANNNGQPLARLLQPGAVGYLFVSIYSPTAWLVTAVLASAVALGTFLTRTWQAHAVLTGVALLALLPPVLVTQVLVGPDHDFGSDAATLGTPAAAVLVGLLVALHRRLLAGPRPGAVTLARVRALTRLALAVAVVAEAVVAAFELHGPAGLGTPTSWLFLARFALLGLLAVVVLRRGAPGAPLDVQRAVALRATRIALLPAGLLLAAGVVMTRIPPPQYFVPTSIAQVYFGYDVTPAPTLAVLALDWRPNLLFLALSVASVVLYLIGVRALHRRGDRWATGRTVAWLLGWSVVVLTTSSGLGRYSSASFSLHMVLHMALNMLGPLLLVLAGPVTLALRALPARRRGGADGPREWIAAMLAWQPLHVAYNPLLVFVRFVGAYYVLYFTPIFGEALRYHWAHQVMNLEFLVIGVMFYGLVIGVDAPPRPIPHVGKLGMVLAAMPFHAFFGVAVMTSHEIIAGTFYRYIDAPWMGSLAADQAVGGGIAWAAGEIPLVIVIVALVSQWAAQDRRAAARVDRHLDRGTDDSWDAYNAMLTRLNDRDAGAGAATRDAGG
ncbi:cytochrome c oxidase assembly protein [Amnibacterium endophyticum]|uniref:Cytochrome c oxidase assembly protein n=1 Tax=Amnibacterium endophyticum TaxID=2109337 RepID=A0ABW4LJP0_9MICO